jgi:acyl carrier protein
MSEGHDDVMSRMLAYIAREVLRSDDEPLDPDTSLFASGLLDSMSVVEVLHKLEDVLAMRIPAGRLRLKDVDTVRLMLAAAQRVGKPRG